MALSNGITECPAEQFTDEMSYGARLLIVRDCIFKVANKNGHNYIDAWKRCTRDGCLGDVPIERLRADVIERAANIIAANAATIDLGISGGWDDASMMKSRLVIVRLVHFLRWLTASWME